MLKNISELATIKLPLYKNDEECELILQELATIDVKSQPPHKIALFQKMNISKRLLCRGKRQLAQWQQKICVNKKNEKMIQQKIDKFWEWCLYDRTE